MPRARSAADSARFDHALAVAVRRFQGRLKLRTDTVVDPAIAKLLLVALDQRARQMELALERWRWLPRNLAPTTLFVNIPAFRLYTLDGNGERKTDSLAMDVVVGRALDNDTPLLATHITAIQTHPAWVVPRAIALKEIRVPALRDTAYLARHHYQLMHADSEVPPTRANVRRIGDAVHVRQTPGPWNALGRMKFVTPNGADIYLHDTPEQRFFRQSRRDFSHGCIRVSDPVALARFVLRDDSTWTAKRLKDALADTVAQVIPLRRPVAVLILYQTVSARESGEVALLPRHLRRRPSSGSGAQRRLSLSGAPSTPFHPPTNARPILAANDASIVEIWCALSLALPTASARVPARFRLRHLGRNSDQGSRSTCASHCSQLYPSLAHWRSV